MLKIKSDGTTVGTKITYDDKQIGYLQKITYEVSVNDVITNCILEAVKVGIDTESYAFTYEVGDTKFVFYKDTIKVITDKEVTIEKPII